jgi:retron-type reverse transcriptase
MHALAKNNTMSDRQYGFTPQKSTEQALHSLTNFIEQAFEQKGFALVIAVDILGAFDNTW